VLRVAVLVPVLLAPVLEPQVGQLLELLRELRLVRLREPPQVQRLEQLEHKDFNSLLQQNLPLCKALSQQTLSLPVLVILGLLHKL
jgi:hypothetical protein